MRYDDGYDEADDWKEGHPLIATAIGIAVLAVGGFFGLPYLPHASFPIVVVASLVVSGLIWAVAHFATMRHSSAGWTVASFVVLFVVTAGIGFQGTERLKKRIAADMQTMAELHVDPDGLVILPKGVENRGPFSKLMAEFARTTNEDVRKISAERAAIGLDMLPDANAVESNPVLLRNCSRIGTLKTMSHDALVRRREAMATLIKGIDAMDYPDEFKKGAKEGATTENSEETFKRLDAVQSRMFDGAMGVCNVLARRRWQAQGGVYMFTHHGDHMEFRRFSEAGNQASAELDRLNMENQMRLRGNQGNLRRELRRMR